MSISKDSDAWSAKTYNNTASFVYSSAFTSPVIGLLSPKSGEYIIDFGCGTGELTLKLKDAVGNDGYVLGVDASDNMIAQAKFNGLSSCFVSDIQNVKIPNEFTSIGPFDAVFSNAALHWCKKDPVGVIRGASKVLKPGGRFVAEMGGFMNCIGVVSALYHVVRQRGKNPDNLNPWYFPSVAEYKTKLVNEGFWVKHIELVPRFTPLKGTIIDWMNVFVRNTFLASFNNEEANGIMQEVQDMCAIDCRDEEGNWALMYVRLRFLAIKE